MICYQIIDWERHFENHKSRTYDKCSFVCMPNKQHGVGFRRIWMQPDGAAIFGVWCAILQRASQQPRPRCGWLTENGRAPTGGHDPGAPLTPGLLSVLFGCQESVVQRALDVVCSPNVGWIRALEVPDTAVSSDGYQTDTVVSSDGYQTDTVVSSDGYRGIQKERKKEGTDSIQDIGGDPQAPLSSRTPYERCEAKFKPMPFEDTPEGKRAADLRQRLAGRVKAKVTA